MPESSDALLQEIRANPEDLMSRLIYADWLEEQGDPLAELIRVQCELAELPIDSDARAELKRREKDLVEEYRAQWIEPLERLNVRGVEIRRGLIEGVRLDAEAFIEGAGELVSHLPAMCAVNLRKAKKHIAKLVLVPELAHIRFLNLQLAGLDDDELKLLLESPHVGELLELNLQANSLTAASARLIARSDKLSKLRSLNLSRNRISRSGLNALGKSQVLANLKRLECAGCTITAQGWNSFMASDGLPSLEFLDLSNNRMTGQLHAHQQRNRPLRTLKVKWNQFTIKSIRALAESAALRGLTSLMILGEVKADSLAAILSSPNMSEVQNLNLSNTGSLRSDGASWGEPVPELAQLGCLPALKRLNLEYAALDETLAARLIDAGCASSLERLNLAEVPMTSAGYEQLLQKTERLQFLSIAFTGTNIGPDFLTYLSKWHGINQLRMLVVCDPLVGDPETVAPLLSVARETGLRIVSLYATVNDCEEIRQGVQSRLTDRFGSDYESVITFARHPAAGAF